MSELHDEVKYIIKHDFKREIKWIEEEFNKLKNSFNGYKKENKVCLSDMCTTILQCRKDLEDFLEKSKEYNKQWYLLKNDLESKVEKKYLSDKVEKPMEDIRSSVKDLIGIFIKNESKLQQMFKEQDQLATSVKINETNVKSLQETCHAFKESISGLNRLILDAKEESKKDLHKVAEEFQVSNNKMLMEYKLQSDSMAKFEHRMDAECMKLKTSFSKLSNTSHEETEAVRLSLEEEVKKLRREVFDMNERFGLGFAGKSKSDNSDEKLLQDFLKQVKYNAEQIAQLNELRGK